MCLLVISDFSATLKDVRFAQISSHISGLVCSARLGNKPVAFLHRKNGSGFGQLGVRIGRYDPIFAMSECGNGMPAGLAEFIVRHAAQPIQLAGIAAAGQFARLREIFQRAGFASEVEAQSTLMLEAFARGSDARAINAIQLSEYGPFTCGDSACAASRKNQSTRWPRA